MRDPRARLLDILEAIDRIQERLPAHRTAFEHDEVVQVWVAHHARIIGEAARVLPEEVRRQMADVRWAQWVGFRHILVHEYFRVDPDVVWRVAAGELTGLRATIERWLAEHPD